MRIAIDTNVYRAFCEGLGSAVERFAQAVEIHIPYGDLSHFFSLTFSISGRISKYIDDGVHLFCKERGFPGVV